MFLQDGEMILGKLFHVGIFTGVSFLLEFLNVFLVIADHRAHIFAIEFFAAQLNKFVVSSFLLAL